MPFAFMLSTMLIITTNPFVSFVGMYKPHCKQIKLYCIANTTLYTSYHNKPLCQEQAIHVDKPISRGIYYETFYLYEGSIIETPHKVFELYEFKKWEKYGYSKETDVIKKEGYYVIVSEVPYMKYTIRKSTFCKKSVEYVCRDKLSHWLTITEYHFIETNAKDFYRC